VETHDGEAIGFSSFGLGPTADKMQHESERSSNSFIRPHGLPTMALNVDVPKAGTYTIFVNALTGPDSAMLQLRVNDQPVGNVVDLYRSSPGRSNDDELAVVSLEEGTNTLYLTLPGRNERSNGVSVKLISITGKLLHE
jgi:hypothetical protein